jgi:N-ethylmaleimide reductase
VGGGAQPLSACDIDLLYESVTSTGRKPTVAPRPMSIDEIGQTVEDYARAFFSRFGGVTPVPSPGES